MVMRSLAAESLLLLVSQTLPLQVDQGGSRVYLHCESEF